MLVSASSSGTLVALSSKAEARARVTKACGFLLKENFDPAQISVYKANFRRKHFFVASLGCFGGKVNVLRNQSDAAREKTFLGYYNAALFSTYAEQANELGLWIPTSRVPSLAKQSLL